MDSFDRLRERMLQEQIIARGVTDPAVLAALRAAPRHAFVDPLDQEYAYHDGPLSIGSGQTISQPYIVALMTSLLKLQGGEIVLEVGTGSGYQAAVLAHLAAQVHTIERHVDLAGRSRRILHDLGLHNVTVHLGDGTLGLPEFAPYPAILVTAAAPRPPQPLLDQLAPGGRLVLPVGGRGEQTLQVWQRRAGGFAHRTVIPVAFVPLIGAQGWPEEPGEPE
ncbi:MAG: protein-L-isoaspartate(D-aspartate) O-methyltransferase [Chloroflexota bacterium]